MIILDTDHLSVLEIPENPVAHRLSTRMAATPEQDFVTGLRVESWIGE